MISTHRQRVRVPWVVRAPWRYLVTGGYVLSEGDNASFLHDATEDFRGKPVLKLTRARWRRVARRNAATTVPLALALFAPSWAVLAWGFLVAAGALAWIGRELWLAVRDVLLRRRINREFVYPAGEVACSILNIRFSKSRARTMLQLPRSWGAMVAEEGETPAATLMIPSGKVLDTGTKKRITEQVGARLGIKSPAAEWHETGSRVLAVLKPNPAPPREVPIVPFLKAAMALPDTEVAVGRDPAGRLATISLAEDSPHVAMSGASGTGKSVLGKLAMAQRLHNGDGLIIADPKKFSHWRWAGGGKLPADRVVYAYRTEDIHRMWLAVAAEAERRIELDEEELEQQRRVWVMAEELNTQRPRLARYWKGERKRIMNAAKARLADAVDRCEGSLADGLALAIAEGLDEADLDPPTTSPAITAMQESVFMGREIRMHVVVMAQRLSASVFGPNGGDVRESFQGGRLMAKWDRKLWRMLVDGLDYVACPSGPRGIWGMAKGDDFTVFRVPFLSDVQAIELATSGAPATGPVLGPQVGHPVLDMDSELATERAAITRGVPLSVAVGQLPAKPDGSEWTLEALRSASKRPGFPVAIGRDGDGQSAPRLWDMADLMAWAGAELDE